MPKKVLIKKKETKATALKKKKVTVKIRVKHRKNQSPSNLARATQNEKSSVYEELDPKDLKIIKELTNDRNQTRLKALQKAGAPLTKSDIRQSKAAVARMLQKPTARVAFRAICRKKGVNLDYLATHLKDGLEAKRTISAIVLGGKDKEANGQTVDFIEVPDWSARHKYFQLAIQIENITVEEVAQGGDEESYVDKIMRLRKLVADREQDQMAMDVEMVES